MTLRFNALPTDAVRKLQAGGPDAYGRTPERKVSDGNGVPCRHCLRSVGAGESYLVLAYRPFPELQPYAETGPIFLHAEPCERAAEREALPELFRGEKSYIVRGYGADDRIVYAASEVMPSAEIEVAAEALLAREEVAYLHMRSARFNCYQCRIDRA